VYLRKSLIFHRNISSYSGPKSKPSKKPARSRWQTELGLLLIMKMEAIHSNPSLM
jgi:hypothetical protein